MLPFKLTAICFATGIVLSNWLQISFSVIPFFYASGVFFIFIFLISALYRQSRFISLHSLAGSCLLYMTAVLCGGSAHLQGLQLPARHVSTTVAYHTPIAIAGKVHDASIKKRHTEVILGARKVYTDTLSIPVTGKLLVRIPMLHTKLIPGEHVLITGEMLPIKNTNNPGDFDYAAYLAQSNIHALFDARQWNRIQAEISISDIINKRMAQVRSAIAFQIKQATLTTETGALLEALLLGEQTRMSSPMLTSFREAGLSHLLAVSGLHVLCVGLIVYSLLRPLCLRAGLSWKGTEWFRTSVTLLLLFAYACLTQVKPAVVRATVMTVLFISAPLFRRPVSSTHTLYIAAFVLLIFNPEHLFQPGFQLSFGAVASIVYITSRFPSFQASSRILLKGMHYIASSIKVSIAAIIGTLPITVYHFHTVATGGLLLNIAAIPATFGLLISGILLLISTPIHAEMAGLFGLSAEIFSHALLFLSRNGAEVFPVWELPHSQWISILFGAGGVILFLLFSLGARFCWTYVWILLSGLLCLQWFLMARTSHHPTLEVLFFNVGHGDAALITLPNDRNILIDTGNTPSTEEYNVLLNHIQRFQIGCIDAVVLTHPDRDHTGGFQSLAEKHCIHSVYSSADDRFEWPKPDAYTHKTLAAGDTLSIDPSVVIRILSPPLHLINSDNRNEGSVVLAIEYGHTRFLFMGDAEQEAETFIVTHYAPFLSSQVIKVGHHGSRTSSTSALIKHAATRNAIAIISTGDKSLYGLPDDAVVDRWLRNGVTVHSTAISGAYWIASNGLHVYPRKW